MTEIWEIFKDMDFNNILGVLIGSIFLVIIFVSCMESFWASCIEVMLMNKKEVLKRNSLEYIIFFIILSAVNFFLGFDKEFIVIDVIFFAMSLIVYGGINFLNRFEKFRNTLLIVKEYARLGLIIFFFVLITYAIPFYYEINKISCAILCGLAEMVVITLPLSYCEPKESNIALNIANEKWYIFRRMDDCLLCGDGRKLATSNKIKLIKIDTVISDNLIFEKCD